MCIACKSLRIFNIYDVSFFVSRLKGFGTGRSAGKTIQYVDVKDTKELFKIIDH